MLAAGLRAPPRAVNAMTEIAAGEAAAGMIDDWREAWGRRLRVRTRKRDQRALRCGFWRDAIFRLPRVLVRGLPGLTGTQRQRRQINLPVARSTST